MSTGTLHVTGDPEADGLVNTDPFALVFGMLLDQQVPMEWAFRGPHTLLERLGHLNVDRIAAMNPDRLEEAFRQKPAIHRYPKSMAGRLHALAQTIATDYGGETDRLWSNTDDSGLVFDRLRSLPGYGDEKAKILVAVLAKRFSVTPKGWKISAGAFSDDEPRSVADIDGPEALERVKSWKKAQKAQGKSKQE